MEQLCAPGRWPRLGASTSRRETRARRRSVALVRRKSCCYGDSCRKDCHCAKRLGREELLIPAARPFSNPSRIREFRLGQPSARHECLHVDEFALRRFASRSPTPNRIRAKNSTPQLLPSGFLPQSFWFSRFQPLPEFRPFPCPPAVSAVPVPRFRRFLL